MSGLVGRSFLRGRLEQSVLGDVSFDPALALVVAVVDIFRGTQRAKRRTRSRSQVVSRMES